MEGLMLMFRINYGRVDDNDPNQNCTLIL